PPPPAHPSQRPLLGAPHSAPCWEPPAQPMLLPHFPQRPLPHGHSHGPAAGIADATWMVILGDGIHNLTDGLAIGKGAGTHPGAGAPVSWYPSASLSCRGCVFRWRLQRPEHHAGDFAMLLQAGLPVKKVLLSNLTSAFLAYLGMAVGTVLSQGASPVTPWIFSVTAGIFLYVALVDMMSFRVDL
uniref:Uncharacterized protein n=1 Tax=Chelydra serpentina TaxID=8475 RepID=A0A8C3T7J7_CHESE